MGKSDVNFCGELWKDNEFCLRTSVIGGKIYHKIKNVKGVNHFVKTTMMPLWKLFANINLAYGRMEAKKEQKEFEYNLTIVLIAKNEGSYIREWVAYHKLIGADHIVVYDNESEDNQKEVIADYIQDGFVDYIHVAGKGMQISVYNDAVKKYKNKSKYLAFIDGDEFLLPLEKGSLYDIVDDILTKNPNAGGLAVNWRMFGPAGHVTKPEGLVIENYLYRTREGVEHNDCIKTIANPRRIDEVIHAHCSRYKRGFYCIDDTGMPVFGPKNPDHVPVRLRINHYYTKSKEEWDRRRSWGKADSKDRTDIRSDAEFYAYDNKDIYDDTMLRFADKIR